MADIRILNRTDLESYGKSIKNFAETYRTETNGLYRNFTDKAGSDSKGEAINAYFQKLNMLQKQVFDELPTAIKRYGYVVNTYTDAIKGAGFDDECFSSDSGVVNLSLLLKGEQTDLITTTSNQLDSAFQQAAEAMESTAEDTKAISEEATKGLEEAASTRTKKDTDVQTAYSKFTLDLLDATAKISAFQGILENAMCISEIPSSTVFTAIAKGYLTADQMYYLDVPKTKEDAQALKAIISEKPGDVLKVDPDKISEEMYTIIANEQNDWTMANNNEMWQHFTNALNDYSVERNQKFTNNILIGEDRLAQTKLTDMYILYTKKPVEPVNGTPEQIEEYNELLKQYNSMMATHQKELSAINSNTALMYSLQVLGVGTSKDVKYIENLRTNEVYHKKTAASVVLNKNGQFEISIKKGVFKFDVNSYYTSEEEKNLKLKDSDYKWGNPKNYTATTEYNNLGMEASEYSKNLRQLEADREKAHNEYKDKLAGVIGKTIMSFVPYGSTAVSVIETLGALGTDGRDIDVDGVQSNITKGVKNGRDDFKKQYKLATGERIPDSKLDKYWSHWSKVSSGLSDGVKAYVTNQSEMSRIDNSISKAKEKMLETILDYGGWSLTPDGEKVLATGRMGQYYDFNATLRSLELNEHGLTNYMKENNITMDSFNDAIDKSISEDDRSKYANVISYAKGEHEAKKKLTLETMDADQLEKFTNIVRNLDGGMSDLEKHFKTKYQMEEVKSDGTKQK